MLGGPVVPWHPARQLEQITKYLPVSIPLPGPTIASHHPGDVVVPPCIQLTHIPNQTRVILQGDCYLVNLVIDLLGKRSIEGRVQWLEQSKPTPVVAFDQGSSTSIPVMTVQVAVFSQVFCIIGSIVKNNNIRMLWLLYKKLLQVLRFQQGVKGINPKVDGSEMQTALIAVQESGQLTGNSLIIRLARPSHR